MKSLLIFVAIFFQSFSASAADQKNLKFFDFFGAPNIGFGSGTYSAGTVDNGTMTFFNWE